MDRITLAVSSMHSIEADEAVDLNTFNKVLTQFYGYVPGSNIPPKRPKGRPPKIQPPSHPNAYKNTISDDDVDEIWIDQHDIRLIKLEFKQQHIEDGRPMREVIEELAQIYNYSYKAVFQLVTNQYES